MLTREEFNICCLKRDNYKCVICKSDKNLVVHHIMERKLFDDGGYYLDNGATLCPSCHLMAEYTYISTGELYKKIGAKTKPLPLDYDTNLGYTKWGDIVKGTGQRLKGEMFDTEQVQKIIREAGHENLYLPYIKYPRTYHLPFSPNLQNDDRKIENCNQFLNEEVVVTEKLDGECTTGYWDGHIHARAIDKSYHESRTWCWSFLAERLSYLPTGWRICGENVYARHSIHYKTLKSYFYLFSIWDERNTCLSFRETIEWAELLNIEVVPIIWQGIWDEIYIKQLADRFFEDQIEGYVVRNTAEFPYSAFRRNVAKYVRKNHVQTSQHWMSEKVVKNELRS